MRKLLCIFPLLALAALMLGGCAKEKCNRKSTIKLYTPVMMALADVRATAGVAQAPREIGQPGKIYITGQYILVSEPGEGIHIINNSNPSAPVKVSFISIIGNQDMAVKGNILYADNFSDLLVFDISDPANTRKIKTLQNALGYSWDREGYVIGYSYWGKPDSIVVRYTVRDTIVHTECETPGDVRFFANAEFSSLAGAKAGGSGSGKGGSMARFTIAKDYLYTVDASKLRPFNLQNPAEPVAAPETIIGWGFVETIFPYGDNLFIGSRSAMYIYGLADPAKPERKSMVTHFTACDPVVVEGTTAYITVRAGTTCQGTINQLLAYDVTDVTKPVKLGTYEMKNPHGLGIDNGKLFVCEGVHGLRFMDASKPQRIETTKLVEGLNAYDVIPFDSGNRLLVSAADGIYQYSYNTMTNPVMVSRILVTNKTR